MKSNYLDEWIWIRIKKESAKDITLLRALGTNQERFNRVLLEEFQLLNLRKRIAYVIEKSPFYRDLFSSRFFNPSLLETIADLNRLPFTKPADIIKDPYRFLCVPMGEISRIVTLATSGTTGEKKRVFFTEGDLRRIVDLLAANTKAVLGGEKGIVQIMLPGETIMGQADALARGVLMAGSTPVIAHITSDIMEQIRAIKQYKSTVLVGYSFYLHRLTKLAMEKCKLREMKIDAIVTTGEPLPHSIRKELQEAWQAKVFSHYGLTEMGFTVGMECCFGNGCHIHEGDYLIEVIDPGTGQPLPDGEEGELVITSLAREGMPLLRYRTGDITRILGGKCACGSILKRIDMITKRIGNGIKLGTSEIHPFSFDENLFSIPFLLDYQLAVEKENDKATFTFLIETVKRRQATRAAAQEILSRIEHDPHLKHNGPLGRTLLEVKFVPKIRRMDTDRFKRSSILLGKKHGAHKLAGKLGIPR